MSKVYESVTGDTIDKPMTMVSNQSMKNILENDDSIVGKNVRGDLNIIIDLMYNFRRAIKDTFESDDITEFWESNMNMLLELYKESFDVNVYKISNGMTGYSYKAVPYLPFN